MEQENQNTQEPVIEDSEMEMKMPENSFGTSASEDNTTHLGIILGILIVLLALILGGLYLWGTTLQDTQEVSTAPVEQNPTVDENSEPESDTTDVQVQALESVSASNEIEAIEADIESTNLDELDAELEAIDAELDAELQVN